MESSLRIVAITNCPAGIAHTYMVAEALEQKARSLGHTIKVETQGSSGVENRLSSEEIAAADYVILATGRGLSGDDRARFAGKKVYEIAISQALKNIDQIFSELPTNSQLLQPLLGSMLIPFVTLLVFGVLTYYVIGPVMSDLMGGLLHFLNTIPPSMKFAAAFLVGAMLAFDMGGPINKTAWFFCFSLLEKHIYDWYAIVGVVALMPPVAAGLATFIAPKLFTRQEKEAASSAIVVGATVATEPAIPYALAAPLPMITANTLAGGITGVLVIAFGIKRLAPGLGIFDPLIGLMSPVGSFYLVLAIGLALNISFIIVLKGLWLRRKAKAAQQELVHEH
ncbi:fructose PTS transporter subunit IIB [Escherichia coli]